MLPGMAGQSWAQAAHDDPVTTAARARFKEGVDYFDKGQFDNARAAFMQAYSLKKHPDVLFNLAMSCLRAGHPIDAEKYFQQFLKEGQNISPAKRTEAEKGLAEARSKLGRVEVIAPSGTEVTLDGERVGTTPFPDPITTSAGAHTVKLQAPDGRTSTQTLSVLAGEKILAKFEEAPPVVAPAPTVIAPPAPTADPVRPADVAPTHVDEPSKSPTLVPVYVGGAAALVGFSTAIVMLIAKSNAESNQADIEGAIVKNGGGKGTCAATDSATVTKFGAACSKLRDNIDAVNADATVGNVGIAVGAAGAAVALGWGIYVLATRSSGTQKAELGTRSAISVVPMVGKESGLVVVGSF